MERLTFNQVKEDLLDIIKEVSEDYVYQTGPEGTCEYYRNGKPSCLVGHVLDRHPESVKEIHEGVGIDGLVRGVQVSATSKATELMEWVQTDQDNGIPWHIAVHSNLDTIESSWDEEGEKE